MAAILMDAGIIYFPSLFNYCNIITVNLAATTKVCKDLMVTLKAILPDCVVHIVRKSITSKSQIIKLFVLNGTKNSQNIINIVKVVADDGNVQSTISNENPFVNHTTHFIICLLVILGAVLLHIMHNIIRYQFYYEHIYKIKVISMMIAILSAAVSMLYMERFLQVFTQEIYLDMQKTIIFYKMIYSLASILFIFIVEFVSFLIIQKILRLYNEA